MALKFVMIKYEYIRLDAAFILTCDIYGVMSTSMLLCITKNVFILWK